AVELPCGLAAHPCLSGRRHHCVLPVQRYPAICASSPGVASGGILRPGSSVAIEAWHGRRHRNGRKRMSGHPARPRAARRLAFAVAAMLFISQAQADIVILSSRAAAYKAGQELNDGHTLSLASGESVTVLLPSNAVREVSGPFSGTVADLGQGRPSGGRELWTLIKGYFTTGGVDESQVAATRAFAPIPAPPKTAIPWNAIPLGKSGIYCVASGEPASVARKETGAAQSVKLATKSMTQIADITFAE